MGKTLNAKSESVEEYIIQNGQSFKTVEFDLSPSSMLPGVYEVIRIIDGTPLFFEDHFKRLSHSASILGYKINNTEKTIYSYIMKLIELNNCRYENVKIIINMLNTADEQTYMFFIHSKYPSEDEVNHGVHAILYSAERDNPNAKSMNLSYREKIDTAISNAGAYEALLVNRNGDITEGSKSNFFAVKEDLLYTSPLKDVLPGITREMVMKICHSLKYKVVESLVSVRDIDKMDGLFMTGTSPQVLPISSVDDMTFKSSSNEIILSIKNAYQDLVNSYIREKKNSSPNKA